MDDIEPTLKKAMRSRDFQLSILKRQLEEKTLHIARMEASLFWKITVKKRKFVHSLEKLLQRVFYFKNSLFFLLPYLFKRPQSPKASIACLKRDIGMGNTNDSRFLKALKTKVIDVERYRKWLNLHENANDAGVYKTNKFNDFPLISIIIPVSKTSLQDLQKTIKTLEKQAYHNWELFFAVTSIADASLIESLKKHQQENAKIKINIHNKSNCAYDAINAALNSLNGTYVIFLNPNNYLAENSLFWIVDSINKYPAAKLFYSDEDKLDEFGRRHAPYFKCEFNYELLLTHNMIGHLAIFDRELIKSLQGYSLDVETDRDYDLILRAIEKLKPEQIKHIPKVLCHGGPNAKFDIKTATKAVQTHLIRSNQPGTVVPNPESNNLTQVIFAVPTPQPLVSIIILTKDKAGLLEKCLMSIFGKTTYTNYEVIIVDNGSEEAKTFELFKHYKKDNVSVLRNDMPFNFSALNNFAAQHAKGDLICLLNNDIEVLTPGWLEELVSFATKSDIGCVGARLWYPDMRLQHGGIILGIGNNLAEHSHKFLSKGEPGYFGRAIAQQSLSAVTAACLVVRKSIYLQVNGMNESLRVAFNDIDFCLKVQQAGYRTIWTPHAELIHYESATRGHDFELEKQARFFEEKDTMQSSWGEQLLDDPAYSPNLTYLIDSWGYKIE